MNHCPRSLAVALTALAIAFATPVDAHTRSVRRARPAASAATTSARLPVVVRAPALAQTPPAPAANNSPPPAQPATAQSPTQPIATVLQRIQDARRGVNNLVAEFEQDRVMGLFAQTLHAQGRLMVMVPNNLRWEITAPNPGVFISSGGHVSYSAAGSSGTATNQQVGPLSAVLGHIAVFMGGQLQTLTADYTMTATTQPNGSIVIVAVPKAASISALVSQVRLVFSPNLRFIEAIDIHEPGGDRTSIRLRAPQVNSPAVTTASFQLPPARRP